MDFIFTYHPAFIILCLLIAGAYAYFLYRKERLLEDVKKSLIWTLSIFRFVSVFLVFLLLLGIILENLNEKKEKPLIFLAHDNSESIVLNKDSAFYSTTYLDNLRSFSADLAQEFDVVEYSFTDVITDGIAGDYAGKKTDVSHVVDQIFDQYSNRNIGGIILSTDGIYNTGSNPVYSIARKSFVPVFTIGLGDTNEVKDVKIIDVKHNDIAFLGNQFPVEVTLSQTKCGGQKAAVRIYQGEREIGYQEVNFEGDYSQHKLLYNLNADKIGFQKYRVEVSELENEFTYRNNSANFYIEVIDGRQKILLTYGGPHPDIAAINFVINGNKNYEAEIKPIGEVESVESYDLIVVHNYDDQNPVLNEAIVGGETPALLIVGTTADIGFLRDAQIGFSGTGNNSEELGLSFNSSFKEILLSEQIIKTITSAPPLHAPFGNLSFSGAVDVLAYQKVGNIQLDMPLIYFTQKNQSRYGVIMGEGLWRWRLHDQLKNNTTANFEEFIGKLITYLAIKDNKDPFRIRIDQEYSENQDVVIKAELYNKSFELIKDANIEFSYTDEEGRSFDLNFVQGGTAYQLNLGTLNQGIYEWNAKTSFQGKNYAKSGSFIVKEVKLEMLNSRADHRLLRNLSENSGGTFYLPGQLEDLKTEINNRDDMVSVVYQEKTFDDLIDYKILFFLIVGLLAVEWGMRKYHGAY